MINLLPDWIFHTLTIVGIVGLVISIVLILIPFIGSWRFAIELLSIVLLSIGLYFEGKISCNGEWENKIKKIEERVLESQIKSNAQNAKIIEKIVVKEKTISDKAKTNADYIITEVVKHDTECKLPIEFINAHNLAATSP